MSGSGTEATPAAPSPSCIPSSSWSSAAWTGPMSASRRSTTEESEEYGYLVG